MGLLVVIPFAALAGWSICRIYLWVRRDGFGPEWRRRYLLFAAAGTALGIWFAFFAAYHVAGKIIEGFPIPAAISSREKPEDPWTRTVLPAFIHAGALVTDLLCGVALALAPLALAAFIKDNRGTKDFSGPRGGLSG
jgi:hypothetical protein